MGECGPGCMLKFCHAAVASALGTQKETPYSCRGGTAA